MAKQEYRLGGGLNFKASEDMIADNECLLCNCWDFQEPGALRVEVPPTSIASSIAAGNNTGWTASIQGIVDLYVNGAYYTFVKNKGLWSRFDYADGANKTTLTLTPLTTGAAATTLSSGDNTVTYNGAIQYFKCPSTGTITFYLWGAGGGGPCGGGSSSGNYGGPGGYTTGVLTVASGDIIAVQIGQGGEGAVINSGPNLGGWPDGGDGPKWATGSSYGCAGGGGSSKIWKRGTLVAVAGGGGGAALTGNAGQGGGTSGGDFPGGAGVTCGKGATQSAVGYNLSAPTQTWQWGTPKNHWSTPGYGGDGGINNTHYCGGGGGGGYYGGGGGGNDGLIPGGGGGGSGYYNTTYVSSGSTSGNGSDEQAAGQPNAKYDAAAGRRTGDNPNADTGDGGLGDATSSNNPGNAGGNGYAVLTFANTANPVDTDAGQGYGNHPLSGVSYNGRAYLADGYAFRSYYYDTVTASWLLKRVGLTRPTAPSAATEVGAGGTVAGSTYKWAVTFWNGVAESNLSELYEWAASNSNKGVQLTIPVDSQTQSGTIARRLYRSGTTGDAMYFVAEIPDNTGTLYVDYITVSDLAGDPNATLADAASEVHSEYVLNPHGDYAAAPSAQYPYPIPASQVPHLPDAQDRGEVKMTNLGYLCDWFDHDQPCDEDEEGNPRNLRLLENTVYAIVNNNTLAFSSLGNPEYWPLLNRVIIGRGTGEKLQDIQPFDKDIICYTDRAVYRFRRFGLDATQSTLEKVSDMAGCASEMGVAVTENQGHIFVGYDGVYQFDGNRVGKISYAVDDLFGRDSSNGYAMSASNMNQVCAGCKNDMVWIGYLHSGGSGPNTYGLLLDMTDGSPRWATTIYNISSLKLGYDHKMLMGTDGSVVQYLDGAEGGAITTATWKSKLYPFGAKNRPYPEKVFIDGDFQGLSITLAVYADSYDNHVANYTIPTTSGRRVYTLTLPASGRYSRIGFMVTVLTTTAITRQPRMYAIGFIDSGQGGED